MGCAALLGGRVKRVLDITRGWVKRAMLYYAEHAQAVYFFQRNDCEVVYE
jgi:hypothetical protein